MYSQDIYNLEYAIAQTRRIPALYKEIALAWLQVKPKDIILELGCGSGDLLHHLRTIAPFAYGIDINEHILRSNRSGKVVVCDATKLSVRDRAVNKSASLHTLEHIPNLQWVFRELDRVTTSRGLSFHAFPSTLIRGIDGSLLDAWRITHNPLQVVQLARRLHVHNLNPDKIQQAVANTNWELIKFQRFFVREEGERGYFWAILLRKAS